MQRTLISGKRRGLTLICKIQIVKSFIIPISLSKAVARTAPEDQVRARLCGEKLSQVKGSPTWAMFSFISLQRETKSWLARMVTPLTGSPSFNGRILELTMKTLICLLSSLSKMQSKLLPQLERGCRIFFPISKLIGKKYTCLHLKYHYKKKLGNFKRKF